jgi:PAS domain S-box-containing protein
MGGGKRVLQGLDFQEFFESAPEPMVVVDYAGRIVAANPAGLKALGWRLEEVAEGGLAALVHPDDRDRVAEISRTLRENGGPVEVTARYRHGDGHYVWLAWIGVLHGDTLFGIARDVSRQHELEESLAEEAARSRGVLDTVMVGIVSIDEHGMIEAMNRAAERIFGLSARDAVGRNVRILMPEPYSHEHDTYLQRYLTSGEAHIIDRPRDIVARRADGMTFPIELAVSEVVFESHGTRRRTFTGAVRDLTRREEVIAQMRDALEAAEHASRARSEFLSRVSHELRTPLNAILGFGQLLEMEAQSDSQREGTQMILGAGRRLLAMIDDVLDISRIESGRLELSVEEVALDDVVQDVVAMAGPAARERGVVLERRGGSGVTVVADRQRLEQVLVNLVNNAVTSSPAGAAVIIDATARRGRARVEVVDRGDGIDEVLVERIFAPFEHVGGDAATGSLGLGLALSAQLVQSMGGEIGVRSRVGEGSTFWFELPSTSGDHAALPVEAPPVATLSSGAGHLVLYIEDNASNVRLMERVVSMRHDVTLAVASSGDEGLARARAERPELIFLDLHLPKMGGEVVLERLKADPVTKGIPVVVVSADVNSQATRDFHAAGALDFITKPFNLVRVLEVLTNVLGEDVTPSP